MSHHVWFRETPSTYYLYDNATGGDCASFGAWDWGTKTCTLTQDIYQTIFIEANGITLDGNGFSSLYSDYYYAVYSHGYSNVIIKNLNVSDSSYGIVVGSGNNITVTNNTVSGYYYGLQAYGISNLTVTNNTTSGSYYGITVQQSSNFTVTDNTFNDPYYYGIYLWDADNGTIRGNTFTTYYAGVYIDGYSYSYDQYINGTHYVGSYDYSSTNNTVYQNNFLNYSSIYLSNWASPAHSYSYDYRPGSDYCVTYGYCQDYYGSYTYDTTVNVGNVFNLAAPDGGNYYLQFDESAEGCNNTNSDSFCDSALIGSGSAVDNLPWTTQDGWATPVDTTAPVITYTLTPSTPDGANGWYKSNVTLAWSVTDPESAVTMTGCVDQNIIADQAATLYSCSATSAGGSSGPVGVSIKRDATVPTVSLVGGPANSGSYYFGSVPVAPTCSASDALSGLNGSCAVSGYSALVGPHTVSAAAQDMASNQNTASADYTVLAWTLNGFYQPVGVQNTYNILVPPMAGIVWNSIKGGQTVPLKFNIFAGATEQTNVSAVAGFSVGEVGCTVVGTTEDPVDFVTTGATTLRYDGIPGSGGQFIQNWQTPRTANKCYRTVMTTLDGSVLVAFFKTKK